jgi:hypothetical protein
VGVWSAPPTSQRAVYYFADYKDNEYQGRRTRNCTNNSESITLSMEKHITNCWKLFHENLSFPSIWIFQLSLYFSIILSPILKSYEFFLHFISTYLALILDKILSTHVLVVSPSANHGRHTYACLLATIVAHELTAYFYIFLMCTNAFLIVIFLNT